MAFMVCSFRLRNPRTEHPKWFLDLYLCGRFLKGSSLCSSIRSYERTQEQSILKGFMVDHYVGTPQNILKGLLDCLFLGSQQQRFLKCSSILLLLVLMLEPDHMAIISEPKRALKDFVGLSIC